MIPPQRHCVAVAILLLLSGLAHADAAEDQSASTLVFLVDRSASINDLPIPENTQAVITHVVKVAALSRRPVKVAVILFNGDGLNVLAGDDGLPTAAHEALLQRLLTEWTPPRGGTPLNDALQACLQMLKACDSEEHVTVVHCGDGRPLSGRLRPDDFPDVKQHIERRTRAILDGPYPEVIKQGQIEKLKLAWQDPNTPEGRQIWQIQVKAELQACLSHAAALKARKARFITVDFNGIADLQRIHEAAGGTHRDYLLARPANTLVAKLHAAGLTAFEGVLVPRPLSAPAAPTVFEKTIDLQLDDVGEAIVLTVVFDQPVVDFHQHVELSVETSEGTYAFNTQNDDPQALLSLDNAGRVATATLSLPSLPADRRLRIRYRSPSLSLSLPAMTIYSHLRLQPGLRAILRPLHTPADRDPPHRVSPTQPLQWAAALRSDGDPRPRPLAAVEVVLRRRRDGHEIRLDMQKGPSSPGVFVTPSASRMEQGSFSADLHFMLPSGVQVRIGLTDHVESRSADEHLTLELNETSRSRQCIDLGEVGDDVAEGTAQVLVRSAQIDYPLSIKARVVDLVDQRGTPLNAEVIAPTREEFVVRPGHPTSLALRWRLPDRLDGIEDGPIRGRLQFFREDLDEPIDVRPYLDPEQAVTPINEIRFHLRRPAFQVSSPRAFRERLQTRAGTFGQSLVLHVDVATPLNRIVTFNVAHTSVRDREILVAWELPFRDPQGRAYRDLSMAQADDCESSRQLAPGETATWIYRLHVPDGVSFPSATAVVRISGDGLKECLIPVEIKLRKRLWAHRIRSGLCGLFALFGLGAAVTCVRLARLRRFAPGRAFEITEDSPFEHFISVASGRGGMAELRLEGRGIQYRRRSEPRAQRAPSRLPLSDLRTSSGDALLITAEGTGDQPGPTVCIERARQDGGKPVVEASIFDPGQHAGPLRSHRRKLVSRCLLTVVCAALAVTLLSPPLVSAAQWLVDLIQL